jgi:signal transduction histidine kinase/ActR/RegA family two-component response regulator
MPALRAIIRPDAWSLGLEKFGAATGLTVGVYEPSGLLILGPINATPLFEAINLGCDVPAMFTECVRQCLSERTLPVLMEHDGVAVIGTRLTSGGEEIGAVVAGYGLTSFPEEALVRRFVRRHGRTELPVWRAVRQQAPLTRRRLEVHAELLAALAETLLNENIRSQQYQQTAARLTEAVEAKDEFLAMLAHEVRNPLSSIRIAMQIINMRETVDPSTQKAREIVERQMGHLTRLLDDLFDVSRITTKKISLRKEKVSFATAVANALEVCRDPIEDRHHSLSVSLPEEPIAVDADPVRLEQVITNLVNNAVRYTPPHGHIAVTVTRQDGDAVLRVRDDGIGISAQMLPRVFDLFTQADRSLARSEGGLGIGLTIVRNLVELHGGTVNVTSEGSGRGSEFVVRIPLATAGNVRSVRATPDDVVIPNLRVLVVEDNQDAREMLRMMLEIEGHRVHEAEDGPSGVEAARAVRPDVALIDIGLPGFDGYEVARRVRGEQGNSMRLIAVSGYGQAEDRQWSRDAGFDAHLVKPVAAEQLRKSLMKASEGHILQ